MIARTGIALLVALPVAGLLWLEGVYLIFGVTGRDPGGAGRTIVALLSLAASLLWSLRGARTGAQAALHASRLGIAASVALPIVAIAVLLIWQAADERPDLGMGGLMLYSMPVVALLLALILIVMFAAIRRIASRSAADPPAAAQIKSGRS